MKHIVVDLSAHGFGHIAQASAVINALPVDQYKLTIRSIAAESVLRRRIHQHFELIPFQQDIGMIQHNAIHIDADKSHAWYQNFHADFEQKKKQAIQELADLKADLLFSDVPYLSLIAANKLSIPSIAMCSLNWADIYYHYCRHLTGADRIQNEILKAYQMANCFLQPTPSMPMENLSNRRSIEPIVSHGKNCRHQIVRQMNWPEDCKIVLLSLGGIGMQYPIDNWSKIDRVKWIFPSGSFKSDTIKRDDLFLEDQINCTYIDLFASCDLVITKTGYGTQTEAVVHQKPALVLSRDDWPEQPPLFDWHQQHGVFKHCTWHELIGEKQAEIINPLLQSAWEFEPVKARGEQQAAQIIKEYLNGEKE